MFHVILCQCLDPCPKRSATLLCFLEHLFLESEAPCEKYDKSCLLHSKETQAMWTDHEGRNHTNCNGDEDRKERQRHREKTMYEREETILRIDPSTPETSVDGIWLRDESPV